MKTLSYNQLVELVADRSKQQRTLTALAGPPAAGKSTVAAQLVADVNKISAGRAVTVPMDGFHLDNIVLAQRGLLDIKGHPSTFDADGFCHLVKRLAAGNEDEIAVPLFDRSLELSRAAARIVDAQARCIVIEGNYLLFDQTPWADLYPLFRTTVLVTASWATLRSRMMQRGRDFCWENVAEKVDGSDMFNAELILSSSQPAEFLLKTDDLKSPDRVVLH